MAQYIDKSTVVAEIERRKKKNEEWKNSCKGIDSLAASMVIQEDINILSFLDTLEVKDPYEQCIQYQSVKDGIKAYAETYSFNIQSQLFPQLTKEQQALWRKEIEQAVISGGDAGVTLARDQHYKENLEVKEVNIADMANDYYNALMKEAVWMDEGTMCHCRLAYYTGCKDVLNKIRKGE